MDNRIIKLNDGNSLIATQNKNGYNYKLEQEGNYHFWGYLYKMNFLGLKIVGVGYRNGRSVKVRSKWVPFRSDKVIEQKLVNMVSKYLKH